MTKSCMAGQVEFANSGGVSVADVLDLAREIEHSSMSVSWASCSDDILRCSLLLPASTSREVLGAAAAALNNASWTLCQATSYVRLLWTAGRR
jgi:hypothetical protein